MVSLIRELGPSQRTEPPSDPCKPLSETWSGRELLPTSRVIPLDTDGVEGADVKVTVTLECAGEVVRGRVVDVKPVDGRNGDLACFLPHHRRQAIVAAFGLV